MFVNSLGQLKPEGVAPSDINRFSFRLAGSGGQWKKYDTQPLETLKSGDQVNIYCHSLGVGPYANIESPPRRATPIRYSPSNRKIAVLLEDFVQSESTRTIIRNYDCGELSKRDQEVFELKGYLSSNDRIGKIKPDRAVSGIEYSGLRAGMSASIGSFSVEASIPGVAPPYVGTDTLFNTRKGLRMSPEVSAAGATVGVHWAVEHQDQIPIPDYRVATFTVFFV